MHDEHDVSYQFAALTREISCPTIEINQVFPRTHTVKNDRLKQPQKIGYLSWSRTTRLK